MSPLRISVLTFGCRVNQAESQAIERELIAAGAEVVNPGDAELVVVNSCSVTATADQGTRQSIRRVARENPSARIVVTGCYATRAPAEVAALPGVVHVVPNARKDNTAAEALRVMRSRAKALPHISPCVSSCPVPGPDERFSPANVPSCDDVTSEVTPADAPSHHVGQGFSPANVAQAPAFYGNRTAFTLRVQTGCEESCSYCVIPSTRGPERSTPMAAVVAELQRVEAAGYKEATLTGVHLGSYGRDLDPPATLDLLVGEVIAGTRTLRFRLGSLEPMDCTHALIERAASGDRLAPAFHLPLQHASDRVLGVMRRPYTSADYARVVCGVRDRVPHASITADVIVGFPGETDGDFEVLTRYLASSPLTQLHVFPYSDRPGTEASGLEERLHGSVVRERARIVRDIGAQLVQAFRQSQVGTVRPALTIGDGELAVTDNGLRVRIGPGLPRNIALQVIVGANGGAEAIPGTVEWVRSGLRPDVMSAVHQ